MEVLFGLSQVNFSVPTVVTVGSFDGVHSGHHILLKRTVETARHKGYKSLVVTFGNHPRNTFSETDQIGILTTVDEKIYLMEQEGVDAVLFLPFDDAIRNMEAEAFLHDIVVAKLHARSIVVGYNHHFGRNQRGNTAMLRASAAALGYDVVEIDEQSIAGGKVSSTVIRHALIAGDMSAVSALLGHSYIVIGALVASEIVVEGSKLLPPDGKYSARIAVGNNSNITFVTVRNSTILLDSTAGLTDANSVIVSFC